MVKKSVADALAAAEATGYKKRRAKAKDPDVSRRLTNYFLDRCEQIAALDGARHAETIGRCTGYFRSVMINPVAGKRYTEDEVERLIDQFLDQVEAGFVQLHPGQSAFQAFAGHWGRDPVVPQSSAAEYFEQHLSQQGLTED